MEIARGKAAGFQNNTNLHLHKNLDNVDEICDIISDYVKRLLKYKF